MIGQELLVATVNLYVATDIVTTGIFVRFSGVFASYGDPYLATLPQSRSLLHENRGKSPCQPLAGSGPIGGWSYRRPRPPPVSLPPALSPMAAVPTLLLLLGVFACSTSVIFIKRCEVDPVVLTGCRLLIAAVALTPVYLRDWRKHRHALRRSHYLDPMIPGLVLTLHFFSWIFGARLSTAINATVLVNLVPVAMPLLLIPLAGERLNWREAMATLVAGMGLSILCVADYRLSADYLYGDLVCLGSMFLLAVYLALGRRYRHHPTVWLYLVPLYYFAAAVSFLLAPFLAKTMHIDWQQDGLEVLAIGLVPTVVGHSLLNNAMRYFRGQVVALASMLQFVFAGILGYFFLAEPPPEWEFYPACGLILAAGCIVVIGDKQPAPSDEACP